MPAEQRVITFGFLTIGLIVAAILFFTLGGDTSVTGSIEKLNKELYPRYQRAEEGPNYNEWRATAREIAAALEEGGRRTIETNLQAQATGRDRDVQRLYEIITDGTIDRVAKGEYPYEGEFYGQGTHAALRALADVVKGEFKILARARRLAKRMHEALAQVRAGSEKPVPVPAPLEVGGDGNPMLEHDAQLLAVFGVDPDLVAGALATDNPGGRANSFRITWNRDMPGDAIAKELLGIRAELGALSQIVARFRENNRQLQSDPRGPQAAARIYDKALDRLAAGLPQAVREAFEARRGGYVKGDAIVRMLETEQKLLTRGQPRWEALADALRRKFPE